jgi:hypothetical protein
MDGQQKLKRAREKAKKNTHTKKQTKNRCCAVPMVLEEGFRFLHFGLKEQVPVRSPLVLEPSPQTLNSVHSSKPVLESQNLILVFGFKCSGIKIAIIVTRKM